MAQGADRRGSLRSVLSWVLLFCFRNVVKRFGTGLRKRSAATVSATICAFRERLDHCGLIGVLFFVDVDRQPLPKVCSSAAFLILGPGN